MTCGRNVDVDGPPSATYSLFPNAGTLRLSFDNTVQAELAALGAASATLDALATDLDTQQQELAAAITANTPSPPPAPEAT